MNTLKLTDFTSSGTFCFIDKYHSSAVHTFGYLFVKISSFLLHLIVHAYWEQREIAKDLWKQQLVGAIKKTFLNLENWILSFKVCHEERKLCNLYFFSSILSKILESVQVFKQ